MACAFLLFFSVTLFFFFFFVAVLLLLLCSSSSSQDRALRSEPISSLFKTHCFHNLVLLKPFTIFAVEKPNSVEMIHLLFALIFSEMLLIVLLLFKTPLRKLVIMGLDRLKRGRGPIVVKTVAGTFFAVLVTSVYSITEIQKRTQEAGGVINPTDQVIMSKHLLEASLMGFCLFLAWMTDRLHHYIRELRLLRKSMEAVKKQSWVTEDKKSGGGSEDVKSMESEINSLKVKVKQLESECETKTKEVKAAEANSEALRKQSEGFLLEYDRLLEDNQSLRSQLQFVDQGLSNSDGL